jgi:hypothetical protein
MAGFELVLYGEVERQAVLRARRLHRFLFAKAIQRQPQLPAAYQQIFDQRSMSRAR